MKVHAVLLFVLGGFVFLVAATSQARPLESTITAQVCIDDQACESVRRDAVFSKVDLSRDSDGAAVLTFQDHNGMSIIRIRYADDRKALRDKIHAENGAIQHLFLKSDFSALSGSTVLNDSDVQLVRSPIGNSSVVTPQRAQ